LFEVHGEAPDLDETALIRAVALGQERTMHQDLAFGFRMLVDVAQRSLSSAMGDPTTAIQAIDRLHDCLRQLATRPFPSGFHTDEQGRVRLVVPTLSWDGYVKLALDEIRHYGEGVIQVTRRLKAMLDDLILIAPADRRPPLERQLRLVEAMSERGFDDREDMDAAIEPDPQGVGSSR